MPLQIATPEGQRDMTPQEEADFIANLPAPTIPQAASMAQARKALILSGISIASVDAQISAIEDETERELAQTDWEYSDVVRRDSPLVVSLGAILGLGSSEIDALFTLAATL